MAINPEWHIGIGINAPFGLKTEYDDGWLGRYQALKSEIKTININPAVGWRATKDFWVGAGVSYQQFKATLTNNTNYSGALAQGYGQAAAAGLIPASAVPPLAAATAGLDSFVSTTGDDWGWGWNVGAMYSFNGDANNDPGAGRIGFAYRSKIEFNVAGNVGISNPTPPTLTGALAPFNPVVQQVSATINQTRLYSGSVALDVTMPDTASLSYYQKLDDKWDILADVTWTGWSSIQELRILRTSGPASGAPTVLPENFKDTWRYSAGRQLQLHGQDRVPGRRRLRPDARQRHRPQPAPARRGSHVARGRRAVQVQPGAQLRRRRRVHLGPGSADQLRHVRMTGGVPNTVAGNGLVNGSYSNYVWIISGQMNYRWR